MTARVYAQPDSTKPTDGTHETDLNQTGVRIASMDLTHRVGNTVDKVDQVSSVTLLGFAVTGAVLVVLTHLVVG